MSTAIVPTQVGNKTPVALPAAASGTAADVTGNTIPNGGRTVVLLYNSDSSSHTVSVTFQASVDGAIPAPLGPFTLAATTEYALTLGPSAFYGNPSLITANHATVKMRVLELL